MGVSWLNFGVGSGLVVLVALQVGLLAAERVRDLVVLGDWDSISCPGPASLALLLFNKSACWGVRGGVAAVSTTKGGGLLLAGAAAAAAAGKIDFCAVAVLSPVVVAATAVGVVESSAKSGEVVKSVSSCGWNSRDSLPLTGVIGSFADSLSVSSSSSGMGSVRSVR